MSSTALMMSTSSPALPSFTSTGIVIQCNERLTTSTTADTMNIRHTGNEHTAPSTSLHSIHEDAFSSVTCSTQSLYNNMLGKTASETGEDTTSMVYWVRNFPWDNYQSTALPCNLMNTFQPLIFIAF